MDKMKKEGPITKKTTCDFVNNYKRNLNQRYTYRFDKYVVKDFEIGNV